MKERAPELRTRLAWLMVIVAFFAAVVAVALVLLAGRIDAAVAQLSDSLESVRLTEEAEIGLMLHERGSDALVRRDLESDVLEKLRTSRQFIASTEESRLLDQADARVADYFEASHDRSVGASELDERRETAFGALEALVELNLADSRAAREAAARSDDIARVIGLGAAALLLVLTAVVLWWLRVRAFAPIFDLSRAMERFGHGDRAARAQERGPGELREMSRRFNEMATAIAGQRQAQMAFLAGVAHDLRNPLNALQMSAGLLKSESPPPELLVRRTAEIMARQIGRLDRMVGDLVDTTRIEAGQLRLVVETHDLRSCVLDVVHLFEATTPDHLLDVQTPGDAVLFRCDHGRIEQVVTNLVSNAIKYSPFGGRIGVTLSRAGDGVEIAVSDQGIGMSEADQKRIFEPFRRVGGSTESIPGAGLGLYVVQRIVAAHGGRTEVQSEPGRGSTFRVLLPALRASADEEPNAHDSAAPELLTH